MHLMLTLLAQTAPNPPPPPWLVPAIVLGFPLVFIPFWCGVVFLLSRLSGWSEIAKRFPGTKNPTGTRHGMVTGMVGWISYRNVLIVHNAPEGLHVVPFKLFTIGHPPIFIPWSEIHHPRVRRFPFYEVVTFEVGSPKVGGMHLQRRVFEGAPIALDGEPKPPGPPPLS
jgi:hypothetical protein